MNVRTKGLLKIAAGGVVFIFTFFIVAAVGKLNLFKMLVMAAPIAYALQGFIEFIAGVDFWHISKKWDELRWWQRGILGTIIAFSPFVLISVGLVLFAT